MIPDADGLVRLWNDSCPYDPLTRWLFDEKTVGDATFDGQLLVRRMDDGVMTGFTFGVTRQGESGLRGHIKMLAVHPDYRYRGIASELLAELETRLRSLGARAVRLGESAPNYLLPGLDPRYTAAKVFFERRGYKRFSETWNLTVDLETITFDGGDIDGFQIRRARAGDIDQVVDFLSTRWKAWIPEISASFQNEPISLHLAFLGDRVVAFSAYDCNNMGTGWFGPMGTDESARGSGLGAALLHRCLWDLKGQGLAEAIIPWVGPISFYSRHAGASISRVFYRYEKQLT